MHLIATVEDTNLYHRGGPDGAAWAAKAAAALLPKPSMVEIEALDEEFIKRNLSPGGCADLLAATYFLHKLEKKTSAD
jgi:triphosphoribosyl-dephospho-CoA synthase